MYVSANGGGGMVPGEGGVVGGVHCQLSLSRSSFLGLGGGVECRVCIVMSDINVLIASSGGIPSLLRGSKVLSLSAV